MCCCCIYDSENVKYVFFWFNWIKIDFWLFDLFGSFCIVIRVLGGRFILFIVFGLCFVVFLVVVFFLCKCFCFWFFIFLFNWIVLLCLICLFLRRRIAFDVVFVIIIFLWTRKLKLWNMVCYVLLVYYKMGSFVMIVLYYLYLWMCCI